MDKFILSLVSIGALLISGCAVHDSIEAVKRSSEMHSKKEQYLITADKASFLDNVENIYVVYTVKDLDKNISEEVQWKAKMFCNEFRSSKVLRSLEKQHNVNLPTCVESHSENAIKLHITESKTKEFGFWNQSKFDADFISEEGDTIFHHIDVDRDTFIGFFDIVIGVTATIIDVNYSSKKG